MDVLCHAREGHTRLGPGAGHDLRYDDDCRVNDIGGPLHLPYLGCLSPGPRLERR